MPVYTPVGWADSPSTSTPMDAANLSHMDTGIQGAMQSDGSTTASAALPVSVTLSGSSKVLADWNATDGVHYQIRELSDHTLEVYDLTNATSLMRWGAGKVWITPQTAFGSTASLALTIGDADTGINWASDGHIQLTANGHVLVDMVGSTTTINITGTLQNNGTQVPIIVGGGSKISVQSTAPSSPAVGDVWVNTSISL